MIVVKSDISAAKSFNAALPKLKPAIFKGCTQAIDTYASKTVIETQRSLLAGIQSGKHAQYSTGTLLKSIHIEKVVSRGNYMTWNITTNVIYAMWVEYGKNAEFGLPYSKSQKIDYSKTKFKGHHYMSAGAEWAMNNIHVLGPIIQLRVAEQLGPILRSIQMTARGASGMGPKGL